MVARALNPKGAEDCGMKVADRRVSGLRRAAPVCGRGLSRNEKGIETIIKLFKVYEVKDALNRRSPNGATQSD